MLPCSSADDHPVGVTIQGDTKISPLHDNSFPHQICIRAAAILINIETIRRDRQAGQRQRPIPISAAGAAL